MYTHTDREHPHTKHGQTIARVHAVHARSNILKHGLHPEIRIKNIETVLKYSETRSNGTQTTRSNTHGNLYNTYIYI